MPKPKPIAQILGNGRGAFRKAILSVLLQKHSQEDAFERSLEELGPNCVYCGISKDDQDLQPDHLWPETIGGLHVIGNVVPSCPTCNSKRNSKNWISFIKNDKNIFKKKSQEEIQNQIIKRSNYMKKYHTENQPDLNEVLNEKEIKLREDLDIVLDSITQGFREKIGNPQEKDMKFRNSAIMLDRIIEVTKSHLL